jgi:hypothetical protein
MKWVEHVACIQKTENAYKSLVGNLGGRDYLGGLSIGGKIILKLI